MSVSKHTLILKLVAYQVATVLKSETDIKDDVLTIKHVEFRANIYVTEYVDYSFDESTFKIKYIDSAKWDASVNCAGSQLKKMMRSMWIMARMRFSFNDKKALLPTDINAVVCNKLVKPEIIDGYLYDDESSAIIEDDQHRIQVYVDKESFLNERYKDNVILLLKPNLPWVFSEKELVIECRVSGLVDCIADMVCLF
jgi:hypothetical protein